MCTCQVSPILYVAESKIMCSCQLSLFCVCTCIYYIFGGGFVCVCVHAFLLLCAFVFVVSFSIATCQVFMEKQKPKNHIAFDLLWPEPSNHLPLTHPHPSRPPSLCLSVVWLARFVMMVEFTFRTPC